MDNRTKMVGIRLPIGEYADLFEEAKETGLPMSNILIGRLYSSKKNPSENTEGLQKELEEANIRLDSIKNELQEKIDFIEALSNEKSQFESEFAKLQKQLLEAQSDRDMYQSRWNEDSDDETLVDIEDTSLEIELEKATQQIEDYKNSLNVTLSERNDLKAEKADLEKATQQAEKGNSLLSSALEEKKVLKTEKGDLEKQLKKLTLQAEKDNHSLSSTLEEKEVLKDKIKGLQEKLSSLEKLKKAIDVSYKAAISRENYERARYHEESRLNRQLLDRHNEEVDSLHAKIKKEWSWTYHSPSHSPMFEAIKWATE